MPWTREGPGLVATGATHAYDIAKIVNVLGLKGLNVILGGRMNNVNLAETIWPPHPDKLC